MNKKANVLDNPEAIVWFFMIVLVLFIMVVVLDNFQIAIVGNDETNITGIVDNFISHKDRMIAGWDYGILFLAILLPLFSFIAARKIPSDTIFMVITFFVLGFILIFSMVFANVYGAMLDNAMFADFISRTKFIPILFKNLLYYSIFYISIVLIGMFTKTDT